MGRQLKHMRGDYISDTAEHMSFRREFATGKECFQMIDNSVMRGEQLRNFTLRIAANGGSHSLCWPSCVGFGHELTPWCSENWVIGCLG